MANTNSQGAQYRPIKFNYGSIVQEHIRYMNKYKSKQEAKDFERKAKEKEFIRKRQKDIRDNLSKLEMDDSVVYNREQIFLEYGRIQKEASRLAQEGEKGNRESILKRKVIVDNFNEIQIASKGITAYANTLKKQKEEGLFNPLRDEGIDKAVNHLLTTNYTIKNGKILIPKDDSILKEFNITDDDKDGDELIEISPSVLNQKMRSRSYSGAPKFKETGTDIAKLYPYGTFDGTQMQSKEKDDAVTKKRIKAWENRLKSNENQYLSALADIGQEVRLKEDGTLDETQITELAIFENNNHSGKPKEIGNDIANAAKKRSGRGTAQKTSKPNNDLKIILDGIDNKDNSYLQSIVSPEGQSGTSGNIKMAEYTKDDDGNDIVRLIWKLRGKPSKVDIRLDDPAFHMKMGAYIKPKLSVTALRKEIREGSSEGITFKPSKIESGSKIATIVSESKLKKVMLGDEDADGEDVKSLSELDVTAQVHRLTKTYGVGFKALGVNSWSDDRIQFPDGTKILYSKTKEIEEKLRNLKGTKKTSNTKTEAEDLGI